MMMVLGIDPGKRGGAVLLDPTGRLAVAAWRWRKLESGLFRVQEVRDGHLLPGTKRLATMAGVARSFLEPIGEEPYMLVVEGLFVPHRAPGEKKAAYEGKIRNLISLAENVGRIMAPLEDEAGGVVRVTAAVWRPDVLGVARYCPSDQAEAVAMRAMKGRPPLVGQLADLASDPHVAEAACIARWGWSNVLRMQRAAGVR